MRKLKIFSRNNDGDELYKQISDVISERLLDETEIVIDYRQTVPPLYINGELISNNDVVEYNENELVIHHVKTNSH